MRKKSQVFLEHKLLPDNKIVNGNITVKKIDIEENNSSLHSLSHWVTDKVHNLAFHPPENQRSIYFQTISLQYLINFVLIDYLPTTLLLDSFCSYNLICQF